jgi:tRNA-Thr(GGU) m(6)t(6)A37 methyltransferase TsaA
MRELAMIDFRDQGRARRSTRGASFQRGRRSLAEVFGSLWTERTKACHSRAMNERSSDVEYALRPGEVAVAPPPQTDAGVFFIGTIRTPWRSRQDCPKRGSPDGPPCSIVVDERWQAALTNIAGYRRIQVLYWMHQARRDLVLQTPLGGETTGTFALRSPVRPNPIASSIVELVAIDGARLEVRGLDCVDGTPLLDLKPDYPAGGKA